MGIYDEYKGEVVRRKVTTTVRLEGGREVDFHEGLATELVPGTEVSFFAANVLGRSAILADSLRVISGPGRAYAPASLKEAVACGEK